MNLYIAGGCGEHGRNCFLVKQNNICFLVDCGIMAGEENGCPHLTKEQITKLQCVFLTHSHADHTGALPWLWEMGYKGPVIAAGYTLNQLPFKVKNGIRLEDVCKDGIGTVCGITLQWGRSGHCIGSVWYRFELEGKSVFFSGDYSENTQVYEADLIRNQKADLAILDCAYGKSTLTYKEACVRLVQRTKELLDKYPLLVFPVPKYGRGMEILNLFTENKIGINFYGDEHFYIEVNRMKSCKDWCRKISDSFSRSVKKYSGTEKEGIVFVSNPQLQNPKSQKLVKGIIDKGGYAIMTGTVDAGSYSSKLIQEGKMELLIYPVHLNYGQSQILASENEFEKAILYHTGDFKAPEPNISI